MFYFGVTSNLLNHMTKLSRGWHTRDAEVVVKALYTAFMGQEQRKKD